jgi:uncharacterized protein YcbK (DUF882 family)
VKDSTEYIEKFEKLYQLQTRLLDWLSQERFKEEFERSKADFFDQTGVLDEQDFEFEFRARQFLDWLFFSRPLQATGLPPVLSSFSQREIRLNEDEVRELEHLQKARHSLFSPIKAKKSEIILRDWRTREKVSVSHCPYTPLLNEAALFEARLIPTESGFVFAKGFCFHPPEALPGIKKVIKKFSQIKEVDFDMFLFRLMKLRYRLKRFAHLKPSQVYSAEELSKEAQTW